MISKRASLLPASAGPPKNGWPRIQNSCRTLRLQYRVLTPDSTAVIVGHVIAHVSDHTSDHPHALIESVDRVAYYVPNDAAIAEARSNGKLTPNAFVQLRDISIAD